MRFINSTIHGLLDYAAALALIIAPNVLGLGAESALAYWLSVAAGIGLIVYSLITDYAFSMAKVLAFKLHLGFDIAAAIVFLFAPLLFGFNGIANIYYPVMGIGVLMVVLFTDSNKAEAEVGAQAEAAAALAE